jgi:hypothetical protein
MELEWIWQRKQYGDTMSNQDFLIGVGDDGLAFTEENMPWHRDENGKIVFKEKSVDANAGAKKKVVNTNNNEAPLKN